MGEIEVVAADKQGLKEFVELPYTLYRDDPYWVPPLRIAVKELLDRRKHPFYAGAEAEFFIARRGSRVAGRVPPSSTAHTIASTEKTPVFLASLNASTTWQ